MVKAMEKQLEEERGELRRVWREKFIAFYYFHRSLRVLCNILSSAAADDP